MVDVRKSESNIRVNVSSGNSTQSVNINTSVSEVYCNLAKDWAIKTGATVDGAEYSSKYYAQQAGNAADIAEEMKTLIVENPDIKACAENITVIAQAPSCAQTATQGAQLATESATIATNKASEATNAATVVLGKIEEASTNAEEAQIWSEGSDEQVAALGGEHSAKNWAEISAQGQLQSDWAQTDTSQKDYIKNKPDLSLKANLASPTFTGTPKAPTPASGNNSTQIATTAFVTTAISNKADKATTLSGYGITDAYTKTTADGRYLKLSGGTLTGTVMRQSTAIGTHCTYHAKNTAMDVKVNPSSAARGVQVYTKDKNDKGIGLVEHYQDTNGITVAQMGVNNYTTDGTAKGWKYFQIYQDRSGGFDMKANGKVMRYVTDTYSSGTSWYRIYNDNWCEQGGRTGSGSTVSVTFLKTFSNTNYNLQVSPHSASDGGNPQWKDFGHNLTTTGFSLRYSPSGGSWFACGYIS